MIIPTVQTLPTATSKLGFDHFSTTRPEASVVFEYCGYTLALGYQVKLTGSTQRRRPRKYAEVLETHNGPQALGYRVVRVDAKGVTPITLEKVNYQAQSILAVGLLQRSKSDLEIVVASEGAQVAFSRHRLDGRILGK
ncbi:MAG TPA: hypothetical protein VF518_08875, partial [Polyangia bacterium]